MKQTIRIRLLSAYKMPMKICLGTTGRPRGMVSFLKTTLGDERQSGFDMMLIQKMALCRKRSKVVQFRVSVVNLRGSTRPFFSLLLLSHGVYHHHHLSLLILLLTSCANFQTSILLTDQLNCLVRSKRMNETTC